MNSRDPTAPAIVMDMATLFKDIRIKIGIGSVSPGDNPLPFTIVAAVYESLLSEGITELALFRLEGRYSQIGNKQKLVDNAILINGVLWGPSGQTTRGQMEQDMIKSMGADTIEPMLQWSQDTDEPIAPSGGALLRDIIVGCVRLGKSNMEAREIGQGVEGVAKKATGARL